MKECLKCAKVSKVSKVEKPETLNSDQMFKTNIECRTNNFE